MEIKMGLEINLFFVYMMFNPILKLFMAMQAAW